MYKVIYDNKIIDVLRYPTYLMFLNNGNVTTTGQTSAQGVAGSDGDTLYALTKEALKVRPTLKLVTLYEITEAEYDALKVKLDGGEKVSADDSELTKAKTTKISILSQQCRAKIINGFSIELSDGIVQSFKLTTEDQLNLMRLEAQLRDGTNDIFIYHATNEPCKVFSATDLQKLLNAMYKHTNYHTTYFNVAKQYVNSLEDVESVQLFTYGTDVSSIVTDPVIKQILKRGDQSL